MDPEIPEDELELDCGPASGAEGSAAEQIPDRHVEQALQAQRLASLGQMATHIAHDFRALLIPIAGYAHALRTQLPADPLVQQRATEIVRAAELGRELVQQILAFAYAQPRGRRPLSLGRAVHDALPLLRAAVDAHVDLRVSVDPRTPPVMADTVDILRVLLNLVLNASQAVRPPLGVIEIGVVGTNPNLVRLTIADNGAGMSQSALVRIIEGFSSPATNALGSGLGLTIVHQLVQSHGGRLWIESEPGVGTTVRIDLPATTSAQ
jgi:signal transduction histidine kinase